MGSHDDAKKIAERKYNAIANMSAYLDSLIESNEAQNLSKASKLSYWIDDWTHFLQREHTFNSATLKRYKRGDVIKVHLGFNIGSEEGGLHYAVVIDKMNALSDPTIRIIPLTSLKPNRDPNNLKPGNIYLGNEIYTMLNMKVTQSKRHLSDELENLASIITPPASPSSEDIVFVNARIKELNKELAMIEKCRKEILKMKQGSIALISQITTISKLRIYDPKGNHDVLSGIKISKLSLDAIDSEIIKMYTK